LVRPADAPLDTSDHPVPHAPDARWLGRRARNVARRPLVLALFAAGAFLIALLAVIAAPAGEIPLPLPPPPPRQDTTQLAQLTDRLRAQASIADSTLAAAREERHALQPAPVVADTFSTAALARRAALASRIRALSTAVRRASDAPLPASYRALAELPELSGDAMVDTLLDSLDAVEQTRTQEQTLGAADTAFMALTALLSRIGDSLVHLADRRVATLRRELSAITPVPAGVALVDPVDTIPYRVARDSSRLALAEAERRLADARRHNDSVAGLAPRSSPAPGPSTSPKMLIAAAAVSGLAIGFLVALTGEMRRPAVADAREAEVAAGIPVLAHIVDAAPQTRRTRRRADRDVPPLIELTSDRYDRLYYRLADAVARLPQLAVLGDDPAVVAIVAANLASAAARTARATLIVDADFDLGSVSRVLRVRREPGIAEILAKRIHWSSAVARCMVGRDRVIDVLPAGAVPEAGSQFGATDTFGAEVANISRRYDTLIISAPVSRRGAVSSLAAAVPEAVVCVRISRTPVRLLQRIVTEARADGARLRGLVLWSSALDYPEFIRPPRRTSSDV
jgi:hypothetical protein